ncbi:MAG TPA: hypothetical protein VIG24_09120 [Acidimicrobiia bacterium]
MTDLVWYVWLAVVLVSFGIIQTLRIRAKGTRGTLSYTVFWRATFADHEVILRGEAPRKPRVFVYFLVAAPLVWFVLHVLLGGRLG